MIVNGVPWFDECGCTVNAHGGCLVREGETYYLFGEYKTDDENRFDGFSCYASEDLEHWTFRGISLPRQKRGLMGPGRIGERVKVLRCPKTGAYVMFMHSDDLGYTDPHICVAYSDTIDGEYEFIGPLLYQDEPIRRWDLGVFQDDDGTGYLLVHEGDVYRLSDDYLTAESKVCSELARGGEAPAVAKIGERYWMLFSGKTSWDANENYCLSAPSMEGPWTYQGLFAPEGSQTCNSQTLFVLPVDTEQGVVQMFMGDRWSFPHQKSAATNVWLPLCERNGVLCIEDYWNAWNPHTGKEIDFEAVADESIDLQFAAQKKGERIEILFSIHDDGGRAVLIGHTDCFGGYARVSLRGDNGDVIDPIWVTFYAKSPDDGARYMTPPLPAGEYTLVVEASGEASQWDDKTGQLFGGRGTEVIANRLLILEP